jgi:predicted Fe-Mo cluster-binding NifX family protein
MGPLLGPSLRTIRFLKEKTMRIAITAVAKHLDAEVDPRCGRAKFVFVVDPDGILEIVDNKQHRAEKGRDAIHEVDMLAEKKVDLLLTGGCDSNTVEALSAAGIRTGEALSGTVRETLARFSDEFNYGRDYDFAPGD